MWPSLLLFLCSTCVVMALPANRTGSAGINVYPHKQTLHEGHRVKFVCGHSDATHLISWTRKGGELPASATVVGGRLQLKNVTVADSGQYICTTTSGLNSSVASVDLVVEPLSEEEKLIEQPEVEVDISQVHAFENSGVEISCEQAGQAEVIWSKIGGSLPLGSTVTAGKLITPLLKLEDAGFYECRINNALLNKSNVQILVQIIILPSPGSAPPSQG